MNRGAKRPPLPEPSPPEEEREKRSTISGFMVPMHDFTSEEALHEPRVWSPGLSRPAVPTRFMVPMHARRRKEATHELSRKIPLHPDALPRGEGEAQCSQSVHGPNTYSRPKCGYPWTEARKGLPSPALSSRGGEGGTPHDQWLMVPKHNFTIAAALDEFHKLSINFQRLSVPLFSSNLAHFIKDSLANCDPANAAHASKNK